MLSSRIISNDGYDGSASTMLGDYGPWSRVALYNVPWTNVSPPPRPIIPPRSWSSQQSHIVSSMVAPQPQLSFTSTTSPIRRRKRRQRPITPDIVIERRHRHHQSSGRHRIVTIPLDYQPTLGLCEPPKRVLEIERVRRHRHRKRHSSCYGIEYDDPSPSPLLLQPQQNIIIANPISNPCLPPAQSSLITYANNSVDPLALFSNLTAEMIENLPKQIVYLPSIHLPNSQTNASAKLDTIVYPTEINNPSDETLSIIHSNSTINAREIANIQPAVPIPAQSQLINVPTNVRAPPSSLIIAPGPFMQQVQDLVQRLTLSQIQPTSLPSNNAIMQPSLPVTSQYTTTTNALYNPQTISQINIKNIEPYPSTNIQPINTSNNALYNSTTFTPSNIRTYHPANITSYHSASNKSSSSANITPYPPANITSYHPTNITTSSPKNIPRYHSANITPYQSASTSSSSSLNRIPYRSANITNYHPVNTTSFSSENITPYSSENITPYQPANTSSSSSLNRIPYRSANITNYHPVNTASFSSENITPYSPANITPYQSASTSLSSLTNRTSYRPANITPYHSVSFTSSNPTSTQRYDPTSIVSSTTSDTGPYHSANITPYNTMHNLSGDSSMLPLSIPHGSTPNISSSSLISSNSFTTDPLGIDNTRMNKSYSLHSSSQNLHQSANTMPRSILRNTTSNSLSNTTSTHLNLPSVSSPNDIVCKTSTFV
ncbi:unnamed protein product [Rotaria sordida]|uniref:Uncharacterized protein n=1 Tax=Rotaria sordida TaxID=392033 RepID=A0A813YS97_9BILA|nr:unnamed protein product [Rotaria sordida]CAF3693446.1 unnamed protein product [Rotaria sordida]